MYYLCFVILLIAEADIILEYPEGIIDTVRLPEWPGVGILQYILVVDYDFEPKSNIVNVKGVFISDEKLWFTTQYKISVQYKYDNTNDDWEIVQKTLKVVKKKWNRWIWRNIW